MYRPSAPKSAPRHNSLSHSHAAKPCAIQIRTSIPQTTNTVHCSIASSCLNNRTSSSESLSIVSRSINTNLNSTNSNQPITNIQTVLKSNVISSKLKPRVIPNKSTDCRAPSFALISSAFQQQFMRDLRLDFRPRKSEEASAPIRLPLAHLGIALFIKFRSGLNDVDFSP